MQRQGIPRPLFSLQDRLAQALEQKYKSLVRKIMSDVRKHLTSKEMIVDSWEDEQEFLQKYFDDLRKQQQEQEKRNKMLNLVNELKQEWQDTTEQEPDLGLDITNELAKVFGANQKDYMKRLFLDADDKLNRIVQSFSIDKQEFFARNLDEIKQRYINNSMERLNGEKDLIKAKILTRINDYALGFTDDLTLDDVTKEAFDAGKHLSRLFARDQMQRFNKSCTLATFKAAGVTKLKWVTCNDGRVRNKSYTDKNGVYHRAHTELQGMIFSIDNLPIEIDDYNCRCGLVPVEYSE